MWYAIVLIAFLAFMLLAAKRGGLRDWLTRQPSSRRAILKWTDLGSVPEAESKYTPQGLTWVNGRLIFANSWKNTLSRVYEYDPKSMHLMRQFDMPDGAVHTSGLAWDGQ